MMPHADRKKKEERREMPDSCNNCEKKRRTGGAQDNMVYVYPVDLIHKSSVLIFLTLMTRKSAEEESKAPL